MKSIQDKIKDRTSWSIMKANEREKAHKAFVGDTGKDKRLKALECKYCFYFNRPRIAGRALVRKECSYCGMDIHWPNTAVPYICATCAVDYNCCLNCGGDRDMEKEK